MIKLPQKLYEAISKIFVFYFSLTIEDQEQVIMEEYMKGWAARAEQDPDDEIIKSGVSPDNIRKWKVLQSVQDRNETLFYRYY